jgi:hypothetical protein
LTEILEAMTRPDSNGTPSLAKRADPKGLLPSTWLERTLKLEYVVGEDLRTTEATLLDVYPAGPIVNAGGARTLISWDTIAVLELIND